MFPNHFFAYLRRIEVSEHTTIILQIKQIIQDAGQTSELEDSPDEPNSLEST